MSRTFKFEGVVYPTPSSSNLLGDRCKEFSHQETEQWLHEKRWNGVNVLIEHEENQVVGKVLAARKNAQGQVVVEAEIDAERQYSPELIERIENKEMLGLSIGHKWALKMELPDKDPEVMKAAINRDVWQYFSADDITHSVDKNIMELSVCAEPMRQDCHIYRTSGIMTASKQNREHIYEKNYTTEQGKLYCNIEGVVRCSTMSEPSATQPTAPNTDEPATAEPAVTENTAAANTAAANTDAEPAAGDDEAAEIAKMQQDTENLRKAEELMKLAEEREVAHRETAKQLKQVQKQLEKQQAEKKQMEDQMKEQAAEAKRQRMATAKEQHRQAEEARNKAAARLNRLLGKDGLGQNSNFDDPQTQTKMLEQAEQLLLEEKNKGKQLEEIKRGHDQLNKAAAQFETPMPTVGTVHASADDVQSKRRALGAECMQRFRQQNPNATWKEHTEHFQHSVRPQVQGTVNASAKWNPRAEHKPVANAALSAAQLQPEFFDYLVSKTSGRMPAENDGSKYVPDTGPAHPRMY